jgi:outer membrane protein assembly factor BamB
MGMKRMGMLAAAAVLVCVSTAWASDWPQWRGPNQNGTSQEKNLADKWPEGGPQVLWKTEVGLGQGSPVVAGAVVYCAVSQNNKATLLCLDRQKGEVLWSVPFANEATTPEANYEKVWNTQGPFATPTVDGDRVYVMTKGGEAACVSATEKKVLWTAKLADMGAKSAGWGTSSSFLIYKNLAILDMVALDKMTGKVVWALKFPLKPKPDQPEQDTTRIEHSTPVKITVDGKDQVVMHVPGGVIAVEPETGKTIWSALGKGQDPGYAAIFTPVWVPAQSQLITRIRNEKWGGPLCILQVGKEAGAEGWKSLTVLKAFMEPSNGCQNSSPVYANGYVFGVMTPNNKAELVCVSAKDGSLAWKNADIPKLDTWSSPILADGKIYLLLGDGTLVMFSPAGDAYQELGRAKVGSGHCTATPALSDGCLFVRDQTGILCVKILK